MGNECNLCHRPNSKQDLELIESQEQLFRPSFDNQRFAKKCFSAGADPRQVSPAETGDSSNSFTGDDSNAIKGYEILEELGAGGFGRVYRVRTPKRPQLALKKIMIPKDYSPDSIALEAKAMIRAEHSAVIKVEEFFFWNNDTQLIIVMEFGSRDLRSMIKDLKKMPQIKVLEMMTQMAEGIDHLHKINIIHRDLKPENIMIVEGKVKITDFGLAKVFEKDMALKTPAGTPMYLAPEILAGSCYSEKVDVWSLGIIFLEMATGKNIPELSQNILYPALIKGFPEKPLLEVQDSDIRRLISKMLEKKPDKRANMDKVISILQKLNELEEVFPGVEEVEECLKNSQYSEAVRVLMRCWDGKASLNPFVRKMRKNNRHEQVAQFALALWHRSPQLVFDNFGYEKGEKPEKMKMGKSTDDKLWLFLGQTAFGLMNGQGKTIWSDGESYEGDYKKDRQHGVGTYHFKNGDVYSGSWCNDEITGKGVYKHSDGDWYEGEHQQGLRHGFGTYFYSGRQEKYTGMWQNDKKHGKGVYTWADGKKFEGVYLDDIIRCEESLTGKSFKTSSESNSMRYKRRKATLCESTNE